MKKLALVLAGALVLSAAAAAQEKGGAPKPPAKATPGKPAASTTKPVAVLDTDLGRIVIEFYPEKAPRHVKNFLDLCKSGFYNGTKFHRTIPNFMIQGGDPNTKTDNKATWGQGGHMGKDGKEINVPHEFTDLKHLRGVLSMARASDPDSASSQFFICVADVPQLDGKYSVFGRVVEGMEVVDRIVNAPSGPRSMEDPEGSRPVKPVSVKKAWVEKRPVGEAPAAVSQPVPAK